MVQTVTDPKEWRQVRRGCAPEIWRSCEGTVIVECVCAVWLRLDGPAVMHIDLAAGFFISKTKWFGVCADVASARI